MHEIPGRIRAEIRSMRLGAECVGVILPGGLESRLRINRREIIIQPADQAGLGEVLPRIFNETLTADLGAEIIRLPLERS